MPNVSQVDLQIASIKKVMSHLYIYVKDEDLRAKYTEYLSTRRPTDSGVDLFVPKAYIIEKNTSIKLPLKIVVAATTYLGVPAPCLLLPRSSISKTPLRLANSIGLIDAGYRGEVAAAVDNISGEEGVIAENDRLFQICSHDFLPFTKVVLVEKLEDLPAPEDNRGAGGFGSTGR